jgi:hypothetical protein
MIEQFLDEIVSQQGARSADRFAARELLTLLAAAAARRGRAAGMNRGAASSS